MSVESISAANVKQAVSRFGKDLTNHNLTKASLDAPVTMELAEIKAPQIRANYFPFDVNTGKIETETAKAVNNEESETHKFISQTALACEFKK